MIELLMMLMLMLGGNFENVNNVMTDDFVEQMTVMYQENYAEVQQANEQLTKVYGVIFVGDKRILDMEEDCKITEKDRHFVVADEDADYYWLKNTGLKEIEKIVKEHKEIDEWTLAMNCGLNDFYNAVAYTDLYETLSEKYNICCLNVLPIKDVLTTYADESKKQYMSVTNDNIKMFNNTINAWVNSKIDAKKIDVTKKYDKKVWVLALYTMLENHGYEYEDYTRKVRVEKQEEVEKEVEAEVEIPVETKEDNKTTDSTKDSKSTKSSKSKKSKAKTKKEKQTVTIKQLEAKWVEENKDFNGVYFNKETNEYLYNFIDMCLDTYYLPTQH